MFMQTHIIYAIYTPYVCSYICVYIYTKCIYLHVFMHSKMGITLLSLLVRIYSDNVDRPLANKT